jgi:hypothetical protein
MFGVHPTQVGAWKRRALAGLPDVFDQMRLPSVAAWGALKSAMHPSYPQITLRVRVRYLPTAVNQPGERVRQLPTGSGRSLRLSEVGVHNCHALPVLGHKL